jgi:serine/threonine-protein kinase ULK/ATG1
MLHRDIKPANVLIDDGVYKICDYGLSSVAIANPNSMKMLSSVGSPLYAAPEILLGKGYNSNIDVFSTGVMVYEGLFVNTPWPAKNLPELIRKQKKEKIIKFPEHPEISDELKGVLTMMCMVD